MSESLTSPDLGQQKGVFGRARVSSSVDFRTAGTSVTYRNCKNELNKLILTLPAQSTEAEKSKFHQEIESFAGLFNRWLLERASGEKLDWSKIRAPAVEQVHHYSNLPEANDASILNKLAVLKLNGGLGTTMGCVGPKSAIIVRDGMTFLDLAVRQIEHLNEVHDVDVPLILMNSFNTDQDTARIIKKYSSHNIRIETFNQSRFPRINRDSLLPCPTKADGPNSEWYPPGHGDIFEALQNSGHLQKLIDAGKEWIFISNGDNLGADVDLKILQHLINTESEFIMEVTDKTKADVKGGTIIDYDGQVRLLEIAQVPSEHTEEFKSIKKFKIFNTNNVWVKLSAIQRVLRDKELSMEIIPNYKVTDRGEPVIQLETAVGAAIKHFKGALGLNVPRSRFLPVKACSDLLLITSDLYTLEYGRLTLNPIREFGSTPVVKLGDTFKKVADFQKRFKTVPNLSELDHLTVSGDVWFGKKVVLAGTVIIVAMDGSRIDIPDGTVLNNKLVSGNLSIIDH